MKNIVTVLLFFVVCATFGNINSALASVNIITRSQWGAKAPTNPSQKLAQNPPPYVVIHHSDGNGCTTQAVCQAKVRGFQTNHMNVKKWNDIAYSFLVGEDGNVYEGRGWGIQGGHSKGYNSRSIGICFIGNFNNRAPNAAALQAAKDLISHGVAIGKISNAYKLIGHRQIKATDCPGHNLYSIIKTWPQWAERP